MVGGWFLGLVECSRIIRTTLSPIISPTDALLHLQTADALESDVFLSFVVSSVSLFYALDQIFAELFHRPLQSGGRVSFPSLPGLRQPCSETDSRQMERQTGKQADRRAGKQTETQTDDE